MKQWGSAQLFIQQLSFCASELTLWLLAELLIVFNYLRETPNKWTLFSDNRSKQDTKKTWQLNCDEHVAEYFHTIQEFLILEEYSILLPPHLACLLRVKENWWDRLPGKRSIWVVWDRKQWRGQKKLSLPMKEGKTENITDQIKIREQDQSVPSG